MKLHQLCQIGLFLSLVCLPGVAIPQLPPAEKATQAPDPTKPHQLWAGKWTGDWEVYLRIYPAAEDSPDGSFPVQYIFRGNRGEGLRTRNNTGKVMPSGYTRAGQLYFRVPAGDDPQRGVLCTDYNKKIMAEMIRIDPPVLDLEDFDAVAPAWKPGTMTIDEARKVILGADADLLGAPGGTSAKTTNAAEMVVSDAQLLQSAKDLWVKKTSPTAAPAWADLQPFIHSENALAKRQGKDLYGREFTLGGPAEKVKVHLETYNGLKEVYPDVWGDFAP